MSNGTAAHALSSVEPHATISAQDLIQGQPDRCGFLRKRGQKERMLENLHLSKHINWRQRFVVVQDGCCYCFSDEVAKSPHQAFSLRGYCRIFRSSSERAAFVFTMEPSPSSGKKFQIFAASSDDDRVAWMQTFKDAMFKANDVVQPSHRPTSKCIDDMYDELETPVFEPEERTPLKTGHITADRKDSYGDDDDDDNESSDDSDYDRPDDDLVNTIRERSNRRNLPLPPVPQGNADNTDTPSQNLHGRPEGRKLPGSKPIFPTGHHREGEPVPKPKPPNPRTREPEPLPKSKPSPHREAAPLPTPTKESPSGVAHREKHMPPPPSNLAKSRPRVPEKPVRRLSEKDSFFDNNDREAAIEILREKQVPGTFLIRKSRQGDSKVLVVMTTEDVKEYKIFTDNNGVSLDKKSYFSTVDDLLENYNTSPLPNRQQTLSRSFSASFSKH